MNTQENSAAHLPETDLEAEEVLRLLHELRVHQVELEMQNAELRKTQEALDASWARYFDLYNTAPVGYLSVSKKGIILEVNQTIATLLNSTHEGLVKRSVYPLIFPADQDTFYHFRKALFSTGLPQECELRLLTQDQDVIWGHLNGTLAQDHTGLWVARIAISQIGLRKQAEQALRQFKAISDQAQQGNLMTDMDGQLTYVNDYFAKLLGYRPEALIGQALSLFFADTGADYFKLLIQGVKTAGFLEAIEIIYRDSQGRGFPMLMSGTLIQSEDGGPALVTFTAIDITELKALENEHQARLRAEAASHSKSLFLANMSHEIRTPMNAILGFSQILLEQIEEPRWKDYLKIIQSSGNALLALSNDILDLSKIEAGKLELHDQAFNFKALLHEVEAMLRPAFEKKHLRFEFQFQNEIPDVLELDSQRLRQILLNLLGNALKFTPQGFVSLVLRYQPFSENTGELTVAVVDSGVGISEELQRRIFQSFEQGQSSYRKESAGTGLGLAISRQLACLMGGGISCVSQVNQGSTFTLRLPVKSGVEYTGPLSENLNRTYHFRSASLLLVDDRPENLLLLEAQLQGLPFQLRMAQNGREACLLAHQYPPDLILMDIKMPVMDGVEALQNLRAAPDTAAIPVVALTAFSMQNEEEHLLKMGFDGYLSKPVAQQLLYALLGRFFALKEPNSLEIQTETAAVPAAMTTVSAQEMRKMAVEWLLQCKVLQNSLIVNELEQFSLQLEASLQALNWTELKERVSELREHILAFELEAAQTSLGQIALVLEAQASTTEP